MAVHDERAPDAPPCDALAEAIVLSHLTFCCHTQLEALDVDPLLVFPEHRWLAMTARRVHERLPDANPWVFYGEFVIEVRHTHTRADAVLALLDIDAREVDRRSEAFSETCIDDPRLSVHMHGLDWWIERLRQIAGARHVIQQDYARIEQLWRVPDIEINADMRAHLDSLTVRVATAGRRQQVFEDLEV